jgi:hypothetical protein
MSKRPPVRPEKLTIGRSCGKAKGSLAKPELLHPEAMPEVLFPQERATSQFLKKGIFNLVLL